MVQPSTFYYTTKYQFDVFGSILYGQRRASWLQVPSQIVNIFVLSKKYQSNLIRVIADTIVSEKECVAKVGPVTG